MFRNRTITVKVTTEEKEEIDAEVTYNSLKSRSEYIRKLHRLFMRFKDSLLSLEGI